MEITFSYYRMSKKLLDIAQGIHKRHFSIISYLSPEQFQKIDEIHNDFVRVIFNERIRESAIDELITSCEILLFVLNQYKNLLEEYLNQNEESLPILGRIVEFKNDIKKVTHLHSWLCRHKLGV